MRKGREFPMAQIQVRKTGGENMMISEKMKPMIQNSSVIRAMFEEGIKMAAIYGKENVYDFSLGNPSVPAPECVKQAILAELEQTDPGLLHGYMPNAGYEDVRQAVADSLNRRFDMDYDASNIIMTVGAASGLNDILKTILNPGDEVITFAPFFVEYVSYVKNYDGILKVVPPDTKTFQPDLDGMEEMITEKTKAVIFNTPNNPTGVVYSEDTIRRMGEILTKKSQENGQPIVLISDEPYRELVYDGVKVPYIPKFYRDTVVVYSYSKSLSLPGERIGYLAIPKAMTDSAEVIAAATIAHRILGSVNAPSLMQRVIKRCVDQTTDVSIYDRNRNLLYQSLKEYGFECVKPEGAFYLFVKCPGDDEAAFCQACKEEHILVVPGSSFYCPGFVRISYCVSYEQIERSLPAFQAVARKYGLI